MTIPHAKILEEHIFFPSGLTHSVKGRIIIREDQEHQYQWHISHHCAPRENGHTYFPDSTSGATLDEARTLLFNYANAFTKYNVKENDDY